MTDVLADRIVFGPADVDLSRSPLRGGFDDETYVLGAFNPGLTRLPNGNLLMMVRVAEALSEPVRDDRVRAIRWAEGRYQLDAWPLDQVDRSDPRKFLIRGQGWKVMALTSLSWLLPVELSPDGSEVVAVRYEDVVAPSASYQCYGVEDARISQVEGRYFMTACAVSPERHCTVLYTSEDARRWTLRGVVLDHQNKDMVLFEGLIGGRYHALTRPLGDLYFAHPPGSPYVAGPSIGLAASPDALHWKPLDAPGLRPLAGTSGTARMGGGAPPILTERGWLVLYHGVEAGGDVGTYRTYRALLDESDPSRIIERDDEVAVLEPAPQLTEPLSDRLYLSGVVFTTGIAEHDDAYVVASGEADLACRVTRFRRADLA